MRLVNNAYKLGLLVFKQLNSTCEETNYPKCFQLLYDQYNNTFLCMGWLYFDRK